ncbi:chmp5 [Symbiodinium natans]|uniref:Chmp5 protein n=1 Tax=Symbiodinium natans TaxID=878477 RepID=A0A812NGY3_9DINO|nr:chmp5 [Symbiodinium natans]
MKRLFGAPKAAPAAGPAPSLSETSQRIDSRVTELDKKIAKCDEDLRRYVGGRASAQQKQLALQCMKRKKMYEQQRDQILGTQFNVDSLAGAQEQAEINIMTVEAMKVGHQDLKDRYQQIGGVMDIEKLMDNMADLNDEISDINEAISTTYAVPDGFDEASFEAEFSALEEEMKMEALAGISSTAKPSYLPAEAPEAPATAAEPATAEPAPATAARG